MKKDATNASAINEGIRALDYDPKAVVAFNGNIESGYVPKSGAFDSTGKYIVTTYTKHTIDGDYDIAVPNASESYTYPGALLVANQSIIDGVPRPLSAERDKVVITVNLPNLILSGNEVENPTYNNVLDAIHGKLESYFSKSSYSIPAEMQSKFEMLHDKKTTQLGFNCDVEYLENSVGLDFDRIEKDEQAAYLLQFKQIFYTASVAPPTHPAEVFADSVTWDDIKYNINAENPPAFVQNVQYGRQIYFVLKANSSYKELEAFIDANLNVSSSGITANIVDEDFAKGVTCSLVVMGGNPETIKNVGNATSTALFEQLNEAIREDVVLSRKNPATPICFLTMFLKDNEPISIHGTTEYVTSESNAYTSGELILKHNAWYVGYFYIDWDTIDYDERGAEVITQHSWNGNGKKQTAGMEEAIALPANTINLHIKTVGETGLAWDPYNTSMDKLNVPLVPSRTIHMKGTTLNQKIEVTPAI